MDMNENSFEEKVATMLVRHHGFIFRHARRCVPFVDMAEDVVQQVFVEFLKRADQWDLEADLRPLLLVITRRTAQTLWKKQAKMLPSSLLEIAEYIRTEFENDCPDSSSDSEKVEALQACVQTLPEQGKKLITLYYFEGVSTKKLAELMRRKGSAVAQAIFRLRERLRKCINTKLESETRHV